MTNCENCFLVGGHTEDLSPKESLSDGSEGLFRRDKGGAKRYRGFWKGKKNNPGSQNIKILLLFKEKPGDFLGGSAINNLPVKQELQETQVQFLGPEFLLEEGMATHSGKSHVQRSLEGYSW